MKIVKDGSVWLVNNWERVLFALVGLGLLKSCFSLIHAQKITEAGIVFGLAFLSFLYANVARFKRFKGLGFEAELWEDKQKEAAGLIDRLREVVSIYTREVVLGKVKAGRWSGKADWSENWKLYNDLISQHTSLGQKIDFSDVKRVMDDYFLFDMTMPEINKIREASQKGTSQARAKIEKEFGNPVRDINGHNQRWAQFREIKEGVDDPFEISVKADLAGQALSVWTDTQLRLKRDFGVEIDLDPKVVERLAVISKLYVSRPVTVTDELITWGNRES